MNKLRLWRLDRGLSQLELAEASGVNRWLIQLFETGIRLPTTTEMVCLSEALGVSQDSIFPQSGQWTREASKGN